MEQTLARPLCHACQVQTQGHGYFLVLEKIDAAVQTQLQRKSPAITFCGPFRLPFLVVPSGIAEANVPGAQLSENEPCCAPCLFDRMCLALRKQLEGETDARHVRRFATLALKRCLDLRKAARLVKRCFEYSSFEYSRYESVGAAEEKRKSLKREAVALLEESFSVCRNHRLPLEFQGLQEFGKLAQTPEEAELVRSVGDSLLQASGESPSKRRAVFKQSVIRLYEMLEGRCAADQRCRRIAGALTYFELQLGDKRVAEGFYGQPEKLARQRAYTRVKKLLSRHSKAAGRIKKRRFKRKPRA